MDRLGEDLAAFARVVRLLAAKLLGRPIIEVAGGIRIEKMAVEARAAPSEPGMP